MGLENRIMLLRVEPNVLVALLGWQHYGAVSMPVIEGMPEGYGVANVHYDHERRCFTFVLWHEQWPEVPPGEVPPLINGGTFATFRAVTIPEEMRNPLKDFRADKGE